MSDPTIPKAVWTRLKKRDEQGIALTICPYGCRSGIHWHGAGNGHRAPHCPGKQQSERAPGYVLEEATPDMARDITELAAFRDEARDSWRMTIAMRSALIDFLNRNGLGWRWNEVTGAWEPGEVEDPWNTELELAVFWIFVASRRAHDNPRGDFIRDTRAGILMGETPKQLEGVLLSSPNHLAHQEYHRLRKGYEVSPR